MNRARRNLLEGVVTFVIGLVLRLFTGDIDVPVVTLTTVGTVMMVVGGVIAVTGVFQAARVSSSGKAGRL